MLNDPPTTIANFEASAAPQLAASTPVGEIVATPYVWVDPEGIAPRAWILGHWLLRGAVTAVVAPGGVGKTTLNCGLALSLITGRPLLRKQVWDGPKRVWMWNLEDPIQELRRSIQAAAKLFEVAPGEFEGRLFVDTAMDGASLCTAVEGGAGFRLNESVFDAITAEIIRRKIDVLIVDPFVSSHQIEENSNSKVDIIIKRWSRVANDADCSILLSHHTSKAGANEVNTLSARGAKALTDACRSVLVLNRMETEATGRFGFDDQERRRYFNVQDDKHNRAPAENTNWYRLASVDLGNGGEISIADSVGVAEPWSAPDPFEGLTGQDLYRVQQAIDAGKWREHHSAEEWVGKAVATVLGLNVENKAQKRRIIEMLKTWVREGALIIVDAHDSRRKKVKFVEVGTWNKEAAPQSFSGAEHDSASERQVCSTTIPTISGEVERSADATVSLATSSMGWNEPMECLDDDPEVVDHPASETRPVSSLTQVITNKPDGRIPPHCGLTRNSYANPHLATPK